MFSDDDVLGDGRFAETLRRAAAEGLVVDAPAPQALPKPYEVSGSAWRMYLIITRRFTNFVLRVYSV